MIENLEMIKILTVKIMDLQLIYFNIYNNMFSLINPIQLHKQCTSKQMQQIIAIRCLEY